MPTYPRNLEQWGAYPNSLKSYVADHFGGRAWLRNMDAQARMTIGVSTRPGEVMVGKDGWLFHTEVLGGDIHRFRQELAQPIKKYFQYADSIARKAATPLVVAMVPHKVQMYPEYLPLDYSISETVYQQDIISDLLLSETQINYVKLLTALLGEKVRLSSSGKSIAFKQDTHWNMYGANAAQFSIAKKLASLTDIAPKKYNDAEFYLKQPSEDVYPFNAQVNTFFSYDNRLANILGLNKEWREPYPLPGFLRDSALSMERQSRFRLLQSENSPTLRALIVHDSGTIGLAPFFSQYFSESLYWWTAVPSLLELEQIISLYKPDAIIWQTSQNSIASTGFQAMLPNRLGEFEAIQAQTADGHSWRQIFQWSTNEEAEVAPRSSARTKKLRELVVLPMHISEVISGKRIKVSIDMESNSTQFIQLFGVDFSSAERQCLCIRRVALGKGRSVSEVIFNVPEQHTAQDKIQMLSAAESSLEDLQVYSISISVEGI